MGKVYKNMDECEDVSTDAIRELRCATDKLYRGGTVSRNRFSSASSGGRLSEEGRSAASSVVSCWWPRSDIYLYICIYIVFLM